MPDISPASAYMSDAEIIAWIQEKSDAQYGDLRNIMHSTDERGQIMHDLSQLKQDINAGAPTDTIVTEMHTIEDKYADGPYGDELKAMLDPMLAKLAPVPDPAAKDQVEVVTAALSSIDAIDALGLTPANPDDSDGSDVKIQPQTVLPPISGFAKQFADQIDVETDQLGRVDQLAMIQIQEVMGDARQTEQLGSNILASRDQTSNAIVGNIRG